MLKIQSSNGFGDRKTIFLRYWSDTQNFLKQVQTVVVVWSEAVTYNDWMKTNKVIDWSQRLPLLWRMAFVEIISQFYNTDEEEDYQWVTQFVCSLWVQSRKNNS